MSPTFEIGDNIRVDVDAYRSAPPARNDVVILHPPRGADPAVDQCGNVTAPADGHPCATPTPAKSSSTFLKRVAALPGDWIEIKLGRVWLAPNSNRQPPRSAFKEQNEPFIRSDPNDLTCSLCNLRRPVQIPPGHFFVMGDNRAESDDSRQWGPVPPEWIVGKVLGKE